MRLRREPRLARVARASASAGLRQGTIVNEDFGDARYEASEQLDHSAAWRRRRASRVAIGTPIGLSPVSTPAAAEQSPPADGRAEDSLLPQSDGAPDTSPVPKKDPMGMDYIPVYADEQDDPGTVKVSLDKIQRIGVRTEKVEAAAHRPSSARGWAGSSTTRSLLTIVALRTDGFIEDLFVNKTGQHVSKGEPLFRRLQPANPAGPDRPHRRHARARQDGRARTPKRRSKARCYACAISAFRKAASTRSARPEPIREPSTGRLLPTAT